MTTNSTRVNEISDNLCAATSILIENAIKELNFDKTIICTITDDSKRKQGVYKVKDKKQEFKAESSLTNLSKGNQVYVTIVNGDYSGSKIIVGKKTDIDNNGSQAFVIKPFDRIFDMTENIIKTSDEEYQFNNEAYEEEGYRYQKILTLDNQALQNYTRLGLKADFLANINKAKNGNYGLKLKIYYNTEATILVEKANNPQETEEIFQEFITEVTMDTSDMFGNVYNTIMYVPQETIFDITNIKKIIKIDIILFHDNNFYDSNDNKIEYSEVEKSIILKNIYLCLGHDIEKFTTDYVEIYTPDTLSYRRPVQEDDTEEINKKNIKMRWVHIDPIRGPVLIKEKPDNCQIYWYRFELGQPSADQYSGLYWTSLKIPQKQIVIGMFDENLEQLEVEGYKTDFDFEVEGFLPDAILQQEKIKAIVIYNGTTYNSNELVFENKEEMPPGQTAQHVASALKIEVNDKSDGNYRIYGQNGSIKDSREDGKQRTLSCSFDTNGDGVHESAVSDSNILNLTWTFPTGSNSMFEFVDATETEKETGVIKGRNPKYTLKRHYTPTNMVNIVKCEYLLNGIKYQAIKEFNFGTAGTMGTDYTLIAEFANGVRAIRRKQEQSKVPEGEKAYTEQEIVLLLYDKEYKLIDTIDYNKVTCSWYNEVDGLAFHIYNTDEKKKLVLKIEKTKTFDEYSLPILKIEYSSLEILFPIAITDSPNYYIEGPSSVIYQSDGTLNYYSMPYKLFSNNETEEDVKWKIITKESDSKSNYIGKLEDNRLKPLSIYVEDAPVYGVMAYTPTFNDEGQENGINKIFWIQPITIFKNRWPSGVINKWDGKSLQINEDDAGIIGAYFAAGKKDSNDNSFSGVMLGDYSNSKLDTEGSISKQTGIYGFNNGQMTYAFKDDGTAFIGKDGTGRIEFNGNKATIKSSQWDINATNPVGMFIDLYETKKGENNAVTAEYGVIKINSGQPAIVWKNTDNGGIWYEDGTSYPYNIVLSSFAQRVSNNNGIIQPPGKWDIYPFTIGQNFKVAWDGTLKLNDIEVTGCIRRSEKNSDQENDGIRFEDKITFGNWIQEAVVTPSGTVYKEYRPQGTIEYYDENTGDNINTVFQIAKRRGTIDRLKYNSFLRLTDINAGIRYGDGEINDTIQTFASCNQSNVQFGIVNQGTTQSFVELNTDGNFSNFKLNTKDFISDGFGKLLLLKSSVFKINNEGFELNTNEISSSKSSIFKIGDEGFVLNNSNADNSFKVLADETEGLEFYFKTTTGSEKKIIVNNSGINIESSNKKIIVTEGSIQIKCGNDEDDNEVGIALTNNSLTINGYAAGQQKGIYARFA